jgi:diaminopimelate epimerase
MIVTLAKHHGLGNDFLVLHSPPETDLPALAKKVCDRRRGIGADGLLIVEDEDGFDARMTLYNADGSRAEMSGNGIRCFAQSVARRRESLQSLNILTDAGARTVELWATDDPDTLHASVSMGAAMPLPVPKNWHALELDPGRPVLHLSLGNPHSVVATDDVFAVDLAEAGALVPHLNLELIHAGPESDAITMRVHERGAGITEACGTGATAAAYAAAQWGLVAPGIREITVHMDGGDAKVRLGDELTLIGPTTYIATATVEV